MCMWIGFEKQGQFIWVLGVIEEIINKGLSLEDEAYHGLKAELFYIGRRERNWSLNLEGGVVLEEGPTRELTFPTD